MNAKRKRQFRRRGALRAQRHRAAWVAWLAGAGLIGIFLYGYLRVIPDIETTQAAAAESDQISVAAAAERAAANEPANAAPADKAPADSAPAFDLRQAEQSDASPTDTEVQADPCQAAMAAALSNARIEFRSSSTEIVPASRNVISVLAALAHACPRDIVIAGHSDNLGPEPVNEQISLERASAVVAAFVDFGIAEERLHARGYGSSRPIADNETPEGRARNRRIEMSLLEDEPADQSGVNR